MTCNRGLSTVVSYMITLTVIALLAAGLVTTAGTILENEKERAIQSEFEVVGNRIAADIAAVDRLAIAAGGVGKAELTTNLPTRAVGETYRIEISSSAGTANRYHIVLSTTNPTVVVEVSVSTATDVVAEPMAGGDVRITFNGSELEVKNA